MSDPLLTLRQLYDRDSDLFVASRSKLYAELSAGRLRAVKIGRAVRVRRSERDRFVAALPDAQFGPVKAEPEPDVKAVVPLRRRKASV